MKGMLAAVFGIAIMLMFAGSVFSQEIPDPPSYSEEGRLVALTPDQIQAPIQKSEKYHVQAPVQKQQQSSYSGSRFAGERLPRLRGGRFGGRVRGLCGGLFGGCG